MSDPFITTLAQFIYLLWPFILLAAIFFAFQGLRFRKKDSLGFRIAAFGRRLRYDLFTTWTFMILVWIVTLFAELPNNSIIPQPFDSLIFLGGYILIAVLEVYPRLGGGLSHRVTLHRAQSLDDLMKMDPGRFEELVAETYRSLGYQAMRVGKSGDHGVDVRLTTPGGDFWIVQCKRYNDTVGESTIRDLYGAMVSEEASAGVLVTTAEITEPARDWAAGKPLQLVDGMAFLDLMDAARRRKEGTIFDRIARWLATSALPGPQPKRAQGGYLSVVPPESGADGVLTAPRIAPEPRPSRTQPMPARLPVSTGDPLLRNGPICPNCGVPMVPKPAAASDRPGRILYRCQNYPRCRVVLDN